MNTKDAFQQRGQTHGTQCSEHRRISELAGLVADSGVALAHEMSRPNGPDKLQQKIDTAYVEHGWKPKAWAARLRQLAGRCEELHPKRAADLRRWAASVEQQQNQKPRGAGT